MDKQEQKEYWEKFDVTFFNDGQNVASLFLSASFSKENLLLAQKHLYKKVDELIASFTNRLETDGDPCACKKGCAFCCHQTVLVLPSELFMMEDFARNKFQPDALEKIKKRAEEKQKNTQNLKMTRLLNYKEKCPFLHPDGNFCRIYQARPMACRIYLSSSKQSCIDDLNAPDNDEIYPSLYDLPLRAGRMMNEGFQAYISKKCGQKPRIYENTIESGFLSASKDQAFEQWMAGKPVFKRIQQ